MERKEPTGVYLVLMLKELHSFRVISSVPYNYSTLWTPFYLLQSLFFLKLRSHFIT